MPISTSSGRARPIHRSLRLAAIVAMAMTLVTMTVGVASAAGPNGNVTYNSVPDDLPGNVPSHPFQAQQTSEFGDSVILGDGGRKAKSVDVVMSSWACESGAWFSGDCVTTPGATFDHPITVSLYSVAANGDPDQLLLTSTETFAIPYRPSADPANCTDGRWYSEADDACYNGFANIITFKLAGNVQLPDEVIWTVAFNTSTFGYEPIGPADCSVTLQGCPYDSLNVGVESFEGQPSAGTDTDENAAILYAALPANYCDGGADGFAELRLDDGAPGTCWEGFRPLATIRTTGGRQSSNAQTTIVVTPTNTQGWSTADTRPGGTVEFVADSDTPGGEGALELTTDVTTTAKAQYLHEANTPIADVTELSYWTKWVSGPPIAAASYQFIVDLNGDGAGGFTTFVFEPYQNGVVSAGTWQQWDVDEGQFWSSRSFTEGTCVVIAGAGGAPFYNLETIQSLCPDAVAIGFGVNIGTNNPGYVVRTDLVNFNGTTYDFELTNEPESSADCKDGSWENLEDDEGNAFRNQGDCVSSVNSGK